MAVSATNAELDRRLAMRESFARYFAALIAVIAFAVLWKAIPADIDFTDASQTLYIGQLTGMVMGWVTAACSYFFFVQATESRSRERPPPTDEAPK